MDVWLIFETALDAYEPLVTKCAEQLIEIIDKKLDTPIEMSKWVRYYAFEVMANLAFGKPFNMLSEQKESYFLKVIRQDMKLVGYLRHLPWLSALLMRTPVVNWNNKRFWRWIESQFSERIEVGFSNTTTFN
jgi:cytochrome P450